MILPVYTDLILDYPYSVSDRTQSTLAYWRPSEARSERDTIRGVQIRAGAVRIYIYIYICMEVRMP